MNQESQGSGTMMHPPNQILWQGSPNTLAFLLPRILPQLTLGLLFIPLTLWGLKSGRLLNPLFLFIAVAIDAWCLIGNTLYQFLALKWLSYTITKSHIVIGQGFFNKTNHKISLDHISRAEIQTGFWDTMLGDESATLFFLDKDPCQENPRAYQLFNIELPEAQALKLKVKP